MGNSYFQFKQFRINQDGAAMKVSTEGCLLGAVVDCAEKARVLDIGGGTGLLSLMVAQRSGARVTAVEADARAAEQALLNVGASPWANRVAVVQQSIQDFANETAETFDLIISNPPFYTNYLPSDDIRRKLAMHTYSLSMTDLADVVGRLLTQDGVFYVLYPAYEAGLFAQKALPHGLYPFENYVIRNKSGGPIFRMITSYVKHKEKSIQTELAIRDANDNYSKEFAELLRPYYLNL